MPNFVRIASVNDLKPGENKSVNVDGTDVALFNVDGEFFAINNVCLHRGGSLGDGFLESDVVSCPLHGWQYNVKTGANMTIPGRNVAPYQIKVEGNDVFVSLD